MKHDSLWQKFVAYMDPRDRRYEELGRGNIAANLADDLTAGLVVAAVAIPLAMGFAIASGLRPEQGIIGGAIAGLLGAIFGGSKYQVYGPTAAFIPVIAALMSSYHQGFLVLAAVIAGIILLASGFFKLGRIIEKIPHSIVVGFTAGIAIIIGLSQAEHILGFKEKIGHTLIARLSYIYSHIGEISYPALLLATLTFFFCKTFEKISSIVPGIVPALLFGYFAGQTFWSDKGLVFIGDEYGSIATNLFAFTPPVIPQEWNSKIVFDLFYYSFTFFFIAAIESLLCGKAADRLASNKGVPFNPDKELRGQGMINVFAPLLNGFPHTGALGRTALNIRVKGRSPLAGISKFVFKLLLVLFFASYLEKLPMACLGGILVYVAVGMIKRREIRKIIEWNNYQIAVMWFTIVMVPLFGFMIGVLSALALHAACYRMFERKKRRAFNDQVRVINSNKTI